MPPDPQRQDGAIPTDDLVAQVEISEGRYAYMDGTGTIHVGPPMNSVGEDEPLMRDYSLAPHEAVELAQFVMDQL